MVSGSAVSTFPPAALCSWLKIESLLCKQSVLEECDSANEFFFDEKEEKLYYFFNNTKPTGKEEWVATKTRVLFNLTGTKDEPVTDVTIKGLTMRDTRITYLDPHGMPSGGDWALQRSGAVFLQGTERCSVESNKMVRLDGNAVFLSAYAPLPMRIASAWIILQNEPLDHMAQLLDLKL